MEHKTPGVGWPAGMDAPSGTGSPEQQNTGTRRRRGRSENRAEGPQAELTVAGVAWRPSGSGSALVVLARGEGAGQMRSSLATLNVFHGGQTFPVTAPVTVTVGERGASGSRQTLRFLFRLPASASNWEIDRMVLRWRGTEVELPPPAQAAPVSPGAESQLYPTVGAGRADEVPVPVAHTSEEASGFEEAPASEADDMAGREDGLNSESEPIMESVDVATAPHGAPSEPVPGDQHADIADAEHDLALLHEEIVTAKVELAHLHAEIAHVRLEYEEAAMASEYAQAERDRAQQWLVDVTSELEDVEQQLADCRRELGHVSLELAARREALEEEPRVESPSEAVSPESPSEAVSPATPSEAVTPATPSPWTPSDRDAYSHAEHDLNAALSQLRSKLAQVLSQPPPTLREGTVEGEARETAPVEEAPVEEAIVEEAIVEDAAEGAPVEEAAEEDSDEIIEEAGDEAPAEVAPVPTPEEELVGALGAEEPSESPHSPAMVDLAERDIAFEDAEPLVQETAAGGAAEDEPAAPPIPASLPGRGDREDHESSWFAAALRRLAQDDSEAAGHLLISILPAQAIATPRGFHYDLVVRDDAVYAVDAHPLDTRVQRMEVPRPMDQTEAWIMGSLDQLGDLIAHGKSSFLRVFNRHGLKVKGQRARLDDLLALATAPLRLRDLCAVGAPIQPHVLLQMIVSSIDPSWVESQSLAIRFDPQEEDLRVCSLRIQDGSPMVLGAESTAAADFGELTTIAEGSSRSIMRLLAGLPSPEGDEAKVRGPAEPLELLQSWVRRLELSSL